MIWWFFFPLSWRYFLFVPGPQISSLGTDLSSIQRGTNLLCVPREEPVVHHQSFPSVTIKCPEPESRVPAVTTLSHHLINLVGQHFLLCPPPPQRPNPPLLCVHSYHPKSRHHHFLPVIAFCTPTSTLVWSNPFHAPQYRWRNLLKM